MTDIVVVGAGVSGLVSALALREAGRHVAVIGAELGDETTSAVAGALWLPYLCEPRDAALRWARTTYRWLERLARNEPDAGVDMITLLETASDDAVPWWRAGVPDEVPVTLAPAGPLDPTRAAWRVVVPRVDPACFLPWITDRLESVGVPVRRRRVESLDDLDADVIVNCTGLGARRLCADTSLEARYGQVVLAEPGAWDTSLAGADETEAIAYVIPRRHALVLGGGIEPHDRDAPARPTDATRDAILGRLARAGVPHGPVIADRAGLRPWRPAVRLEREGRVVHNYGHGGAGWTLCRGCTEDVVSLAAHS